MAPTIRNLSWSKFMGSLNPLSMISFTTRVKGHLGNKFFLLLSYVYYISKGVCNSVLGSMMFPYFREHGQDHIQMTYNSTVALLPWSMKGFFGVVSDLFPLFGYSKTSYMLIFYISGSIASFVFLVLPDETVFSMWQLPGLMLFFCHVPNSAADLFTEGKYVQKIKQHPESRSDIVSYVWWCQISLSSFPSIIIGIIAEDVNMRWAHLVVLPFMLGAIPLLLTGCMVDDKVATNKANRFDVEKFKANWKLMTVGFSMGSLALILALLFGASIAVIIAVALIGSTLLCVLVWFFMPKVIGKAVIYLFLTTATYAGTAGASDFWALGDEECVPGGPNLDYQIILTYGSLISLVASLVGIWCFSTFISNMPLRMMFWTTTLLRISCGFLFIGWIERWNVALGINDFIFYAIGDNAIPNILYMMDFMPANILIAKLCPKDVESTVYAILAGFSNFGSTLSSYYSIPLSEAFDIKTTVPCDFSNLSLLYAIGSMILPLVQIPLTFVLIPKGYIDDDLLCEAIYIPKDDTKRHEHELVQC